MHRNEYIEYHGIENKYNIIIMEPEAITIGNGKEGFDT